MRRSPVHPAAGSRLEDRLTRTWHLIRRPLTTRRRPYMMLNRLRASRSDLLVRADSSLLIEGPMRSGNTYAVAAFRLANGPDHHVARHMHAPAHVLQAVHLGVPALILLRDPVDACVSHVLRRPALTLTDSLQDYLTFYRALEQVRGDLVVVPFEVLISDYGAALQEVNRRFGTAFRLYERTEENEREVRRIVEEMHRAETGRSATIDEMRVARPSPRRAAARELLRAELDEAAVRPLVGEARHLFASWHGQAATTPPAADG